MSSKYMKADWTLHDGGDGAWTLETRRDDGRVASFIATRPPWPSSAAESVANGHLCKAAPKMYEALQAYMRVREQLNHLPDEDLVQLQIEFHLQAVAALARADGSDQEMAVTE